jgi:hypothetical protein
LFETYDDRTTNEYCDILRVSWLNQATLSPEIECSDCVLGSMQTELNSPLAFHPEYAEDFASRTSSCGKNNYSYMTPPSYTITPSVSVSVSTITSEPTASCRASHLVVEGDTCTSIALQYGVSSFSVAVLNGLTPSCKSLLIGQTICIGAQCPTHQVAVNETCNDIVASLGTTATSGQFMAWNPNIDVLCGNLHKVPDMVVCVG